jgi:hypothetical protein
MISDIEYVFETACLSKANLSEDTANDIIDRVLMYEGLVLFYYKCVLCGSHHLTRQEPDKTKETLEVI